ncbi:uroporphyrinogen decarboxylase family protein [Streptococcus macacae]|uniref:Uroporphyrinogen decarboxylase n=1 Tax=Streptococcus macacae NCTC 11558 TaxID=764298 RepID=G5JU34_9STRE|nr:uroporphyrinogen decarboxylase family protein [Streptococcus macacae]EHJ52151.1 uroporphyrinogen decarboxylase [Streptococcus macacae NCTC 11558]SUN78399.1 uroporphyrinogen decarboxylase [Streptococcus macacae NCTC 11558]
MARNKKEWVLKAFRGEEVDRVPVGFWYHFLPEEEFGQGLDNAQLFDKNWQGHQKFIKEVDPDFIKIMSDGFFNYPNELIHKGVSSVRELANIVSIGENHPWFDQQVELVKAIKRTFSEDILAIYNIFAPVTYLKWQLSGQVAHGDSIIAQFLQEDAKTLKKVLNVIAGDIAILAKKIIAEAGIEGIYLSVQSIQDSKVTSEDYRHYIAPSDLAIIEAAHQADGLTVLHICGYEGASNDIELFKDYPAQVFNWAVGPEGISLAQGRKLFGGKTVLGGFVNTKDGILYKGSKEEIQAQVRKLLQESGSLATIIGADCTIPSDIASERIAWVKEAVTL